MNLKLDVDKARKTSVRKFSGLTKVTLALGAVIVGVLGVQVATDLTLNKTVEVVELKTAVPQDGPVTQSNMEEEPMSLFDYNNQGIYTLANGEKRRSIVLWSDRGIIQNAYASYYIRQNTPVYWDSLTKQTPEQESYLYSMSGQLLRVAINADEFGNILVPGDHIDVYASYTQNNYALPSPQTYAMDQQLGIQPQTSQQEETLLFADAPVVDILNSQGNSIFDIYYNLMQLPSAQQQAEVASSSFQQSVQPTAILLDLTPEEVARYELLQSEGASLNFTLLPRTSNNLIAQTLSELKVGFARSGNSGSGGN